MSRSGLVYSERRAPVRAEGFDPDVPIAGFYRTRLRSGGVFVGVRIWFGPPHDPDTGEEMDRSHRWQAEVNGKPYSLERVWPGCAGDPITAGEYAYLASLQAWGEQSDPDGAIADPHKRLDPLTTPLLF